MPHPGWRHRVPAGRVVLCDQAAALARVAELVDVELWRADRRAVSLEVLRGLVHGMAWSTRPPGADPREKVAPGLVAGVTRAHLAAVAGCSPRTVSRVIAWAIEAGLVVVVETGATAAFLGTEANRAPSYVLTVPVGWVPPVGAGVAPDGGGFGEVSEVDGQGRQGVGERSVDGVGNPPASCVSQVSPRRDHGLNNQEQELREHAVGARGGQDRRAPGSWPVRDRAETASQRAAAAATVLERTGIAGRVVGWRAAALLGPWFASGWCVAGLLWAIDHHPDELDPDPRRTRGDATRSARDPLAVLAHRLAPWRGRLAALPPGFAAVDGQARRRRAAALAEAGESPPVTPAVAPDVAPAVASRSAGWCDSEPSLARARALAEIGRVLDRRDRGDRRARRDRRGRPEVRG